MNLDTDALMWKAVGSAGIVKMGFVLAGFGGITPQVLLITAI